MLATGTKLQLISKQPKTRERWGTWGNLEDCISELQGMRLNGYADADHWTPSDVESIQHVKFSPVIYSIRHGSGHDARTNYLLHLTYIGAFTQ